MLKEGQKAPSFVLPSSDGTTVDIADLRGTAAVLYFYPRDNTPGCTIEAQEFRDALPAFKQAGAAVFGISRDSIASHCKFRDKYGLSFPLLTDEDTKMMSAYGAWGEKTMYGKKMTGIIRSTVLVDKDGNVARVWPKVQVKGHAAAVLDAVKGLGGNGAPAPAPPPKAPPKKKAAAPAKAKKKAAAPAKAKKKAAPAKAKKKPAAKKRR